MTRSLLRGPVPVSVMTRLHRYFTPSSPTACWLWEGGMTRNGYGKVRVGSVRNGTRRIAPAHRVMWEQCMGPVPEGLNVLHRCDVRHCVNPSHLEVGTQRKNIRDAVLRGRLHGPVEFPWETIQQVRTRSQAGLTQSALGQEFGMSQSHVSRLLHGRQRRFA